MVKQVSMHEMNYEVAHGIIKELRQLLNLSPGESLKEAVKGLMADSEELKTMRFYFQQGERECP